MADDVIEARVNIAQVPYLFDSYLKAQYNELANGCHIRTLGREGKSFLCYQLSMPIRREKLPTVLRP